jgi:membrane-associated phospholipid phosphatase
MKPWERVVFGLAALTILAAIGVKLHELDMPVARFVRSFDIDALNLIGDLMALPGKGEVVVGAFILIGLLGWRRQRHQLAPMTFSMAGVGQWVGDWWRQRDQLTDIGMRGILAQLCIAAATQLLKHFIGRPRPRFAHGDELVLGPSLDSGLDSFPSGHAANAFGAATFLAWFFPAVRVPLYLVAGLVAVSRVLRGSHFPTDVLAGAVLGIVIGSLVAVGLKRWPVDALPGLLRTGTPVAVSTFAMLWVVLHPAPAWSYEVISLGVGVALVLAGGFVRGLSWTYLEGEDKGPLRALGRLLLIIGVAVGCAPWWAAVLLGVALVPLGVAGFRHPLPHPPPSWPIVSGRAMGAPEGKGGGALPRALAEVPLWGREGLAVGAALVILAALQSVKGLLPLG